jgi:hypothetical protein
MGVSGIGLGAGGNDDQIYRLLLRNPADFDKRFSLRQALLHLKLPFQLGSHCFV